MRNLFSSSSSFFNLKKYFQKLFNSVSQCSWIFKCVLNYVITHTAQKSRSENHALYTIIYCMHSRNHLPSFSAYWACCVSILAYQTFDSLLVIKSATLSKALNNEPPSPLTLWMSSKGERSLTAVWGKTSLTMISIHPCLFFSVILKRFCMNHSRSCCNATWRRKILFVYCI